MTINKNNIYGVAMKKLLLMIAMIISGFTAALSQSFEIVNIYTDEYPEIKMEFKVTDANGEEIRYFNVTDFEISENCDAKQPNRVFCPSPGQTKVSYIFTFDRSPSMFELVPGTGLTKGQQVIKAFEEMLKNMPSPKRWEAAVVSFAGLAYLMQDFTNDKDSLLKAVEETYKTSRAQTDFNAGFLYDVNNNPGALYVAKNAKYKPVVLFMTDGEHNFQRNVTPSRVNVWEGEIISTANDLVISTGEQIPATIYAMTLGYPMPSYLRNIATSTPHGEAIESPLNDQIISRVIVAIVNKAGSLGSPSPCELSWLSCCEGGNLHITCKLNGISIDTVYTVDANLKPYLEVVPPAHYFANVLPGTSVTQTIQVTARNNYVLFDNTTPFTFTDNRFEFVSANINGLKLPKDSTIELTLQFTSPDSNYYKTDIHFNSTACNGNDFMSDAGWLYQQDVYVGSGTIGNPKDAVVSEVLCNKTGKTITINSMSPDGGNASDFAIVSPVPPFDLPHDSCITLTIRFTPSAEGIRSTTLKTETSNGTLNSRLWGDGSGYPEIRVSPADIIDYPASNCKELIHDTTITITNIGALALDISSVSLSNITDFEPVAWPSLPLSLSPNNSANFVVRFNPQSLGNKSCAMTIESNSKNNPTYVVNLNGVRDSVGFTVSAASVDFGMICPGEEIIKEINLVNTGSTAITVTANDDGEFTLAPNTWTIDPGLAKTVNIKFVATDENTYNGTIVFTDDFCDYSYSVQVTAIVVAPHISYQPLTIQSTVGSSSTGVMKITNTSQRNMTVENYIVPCNEFTIESPSLPWDIPAGETIDVTFKYTPVSDNGVNCFITLEGTPCDFLDSVQVTGTPDMATATLEIEKHTGLAGFNIQIPIYLRNRVNVVESGATHIATRLTYDQNLLTNPVINNGNITVNSGYIDISDIALSQLSGDLLATLTFRVNLSVPETTPLDLSNAVSVGGSIYLTEIDGQFTLLPSSATLSIDKAEGKTGDIVDIPVRLTDYNNLDPVHKSILTTLTYNYSVLEPTGNTPKGTVNGDMREIELKLPVMPGAGGILETLRFKVMLGTADKIPLYLKNTRTEAGNVDFNVVDGEFTVTNVCESGDVKRLFDPRGIAQIISISPNPGGSGQTGIRFESQEEGMHSMEIYSYQGVRIAEVFNKQLKPGVYEVFVNTNDISDGVYYIIYRTPTKLLTKTMSILK